MPAVTKKVSTVVVTASTNSTIASAFLNALSSQPRPETRSLAISLATAAQDDTDKLLQSTHIDTVVLIPPTHADEASLAKTKDFIASCSQSNHVDYIILLSAMMSDAVESKQRNAKLTQFESHYLALERSLRQSRIPHTILRLAPLQQSLLYLDTGFHTHQVATLALPISNGAFAPIHVDDVARALVSILNSHNSPHISKTYTLTGPDLLTGVELAGRASVALDRPVRFQHTSQRHLDDLARQHSHLPIPTLLQVTTLIANSRYTTHTDTLASLIGRTPKSIDYFFREHRQDFNKDITKNAPLLGGRPKVRQDAFNGELYRGAWGDGLGRYAISFSSKL
ncbi:hypothetical protein HDU85_001561 [Gaertneriomyces sp. JEL0708]|nr:hypothetical protein HDU85_001561 [Gaertneriomyces sp. JEL0708]